ALPPGAQGSPVVGAALQAYLDAESELMVDGWMAREHALGFLANALVAGCSVQGRSFTPREASDAVLATCNLGLECWPQHWPPAATQDVVTVFRVGWGLLPRAGRRHGLSRRMVSAPARRQYGRRATAAQCAGPRGAQRSGPPVRVARPRA